MLSWIIVSLQQACWREHSDQCSISQSTIADEIGIERRTVSRVLKENPLRHWYIPEVEYQKGIVNHKRKTYQPLPNKYTIYLSTPLTPEHMTGLYQYLQIQCPGGSIFEIEQALNALLALKGKEALALLEKQYQAGHSDQFESPVPLSKILGLATGLRLNDLPSAQAADLEKKISGVHTHLTEIGYTSCRQYFRLNWVPKLGPAMAWLILGLRSRCYYNPDTGEHRDVCTWRKKELATLLGQSRYNLRLLLAHQYAGHFFKITDNQKQKITVKVSMIQEPLVTETADQFWDRQSPITKNVEKCDITPPENVEKSDSTPPKNVEIYDITPSENVENYASTPSKTLKNVTSPPKNVENYASYKYFKDSVPYVNIRQDDLIQNNDIVIYHDQENLKALLANAGLSGSGLNKLCKKNPPFNLQMVKAVILYAEANNLKPGYIYRHLDEDAVVDELFLQFAALDDEILAIFKQAVSELKVKGPLMPDIRTPIPENLIELFTQFAQAFAGAEPAIVAATLRRDRAIEIDGESADTQPSGLNTFVSHSELDLLWNQVLEQLQLQMTRGTFDSWLKDTRLIAREGLRFRIGVKNAFAKDWLENRLFTTIQRTLANWIGDRHDQTTRVIEIEFVVI